MPSRGGCRCAVQLRTGLTEQRGGLSAETAQLWIVWLVEAGLIFGIAAYAARRVANGGAFCETCGQWAAGPRTIAA